MSGHSKWATLKHKKAATDARCGRVFTRVTLKLRSKLGDDELYNLMALCARCHGQQHGKTHYVELNVSFFSVRAP